MRWILTFTATLSCLWIQSADFLGAAGAGKVMAAESVASGSKSAEPRTSDAMRNKQEAQQRARGMAKELITGILDIQIKQLKENGLDKLPIYAEIVSMRKNIDKLVEAEMLDVVDILIKAQNGPSAERQARFNEARDKIREIVVKLSVERQNLLRRLKIAELAAQVRRLIQLETGVLRVSQTLPEQAAGKREQATLATIEDQRDVIVLFSQLVAMLGDVSTWGGPVAQAPPTACEFSKPVRSTKNWTDRSGIWNRPNLPKRSPASGRPSAAWKPCSRKFKGWKA